MTAGSHFKLGNDFKSRIEIIAQFLCHPSKVTILASAFPEGVR